MAPRQPHRQTKIDHMTTDNTERKMVKVHINSTKYIFKTAYSRITKQLTWTYNTYTTNIPHPSLIEVVNAHSTLWDSYTDDHRGQLLSDVLSNSDTPTRVPNTTLQQTSSPDITLYTPYNQTSWTTQHALSSDHLPIITTINIRMTTDYNKIYELLQTTRKPTGHNLPKAQSPLSFRPHTHCQYNFNKHYPDGR